MVAMMKEARTASIFSVIFVEYTCPHLSLYGATPQAVPEAGIVLPVIDRNRCDGKQDCVAVCLFDVFAMQRVSALDLVMLPVAPRKAHKLIGEWQAHWQMAG